MDYAFEMFFWGLNELYALPCTCLCLLNMQLVASFGRHLWFVRCLLTQLYLNPVDNIKLLQCHALHTNYLCVNMGTASVGPDGYFIQLFQRRRATWLGEMVYET